MDMFWKIIDVSFVSVRSKSSKFKTPSELNTIVRMRMENKKLFGELLETPDKKKKKKALKKSKTDSELKSDAVPASRTQAKNSKHSSQNSIYNSLDSNLCMKNEIEGSFEKLQNLDEKTLLSIPFLNVRKNKYMIEQEEKPMLIRKLTDYHREYESISTILSRSMSAESEANLQRWKSSMISQLGAKEFEKYSEDLMKQGSLFRKIILNYLKTRNTDQLKIDSQFESYWNSLIPVFPLFPSIIETEGLVAHQLLKYKGSCDCLAVFRNEIVLVSWKKSDKYVPTLQRAFDVPIQVAACMGALNFDNRYSFRVEQALIVMAYNDGRRADLFHLNQEKCILYWHSWLKRLQTFRIRQSENEELADINSNSLKSTNLICPEKIDVDLEIDKVPKNNLISGISLGNTISLDYSKISDESSLDHPLYNTAKNDFDSGKSFLIQGSNEFHNSYPSVSTILSDSKSESAKLVLERWKQQMIEKLGVDGFEVYRKNILDSGTLLHEKIRIRLTENRRDLDIPESIQGFWSSLSGVFPLISDVQVTEGTVAHPVLKYRGIIDCIALFNNKLMLIDWKTSEKLKPSISTTYDAPLQIAAYIGAVNYDSSYPFKVVEGLIVVAYNDGTKADVFHMNEEKSTIYWKKWLQRLNKYNSMAYEDGTKLKY